MFSTFLSHCPPSYLRNPGIWFFFLIFYFFVFFCVVFIMFRSGLCTTKRIVNYGKQDSLITCRVPSCRPYVEKCTIIFLQRCVVPRQQVTSVEVGSSCTEPSYGTYRSLCASKDFDRIQLKRLDVIGLHIMHCRGGYLRNTVTFQGPHTVKHIVPTAQWLGPEGFPMARPHRLRITDLLIYWFCTHFQFFFSSSRIQSSF